MIFGSVVIPVDSILEQRGVLFSPTTCLPHYISLRHRSIASLVSGFASSPHYSQSNAHVHLVHKLSVCGTSWHPVCGISLVHRYHGFIAVFLLQQPRFRPPAVFVHCSPPHPWCRTQFLLATAILVPLNHHYRYHRRQVWAIKLIVHEASISSSHVIFVVFFCVR